MSQEESLRERSPRPRRHLRGARPRLPGSSLLLALRLTAKREDAEEAAQDAFVKAYRALATYPAESIRGMALRAWLYRITLNTARNRFRGKKLRTVSLDHPIAPGSDAMWEPPTTRRSGPTHATRNVASGGTSPASWPAFPDRYRSALQLRYVEGLRLEEVATRARAAARDGEVERPSRNQRLARGSFGVPPGGGEVVTTMREVAGRFEGPAVAPVEPGARDAPAGGDAEGRSGRHVLAAGVAAGAGVRRAQQGRHLDGDAGEVRRGLRAELRAALRTPRISRRSRCLRPPCARSCATSRARVAGSCGSTCAGSPSSSGPCF